MANENICDVRVLSAEIGGAITADISYIWTAQGWLYLAIVVGLYPGALSAGRPAAG